MSEHATTPRQSALEAVAEAAERVLTRGSPFDFNKLSTAIVALDALGPADTDDGWRPVCLISQMTLPAPPQHAQEEEE